MTKNGRFWYKSAVFKISVVFFLNKSYNNIYEDFR